MKNDLKLRSQQMWSRLGIARLRRVLLMIFLSVTFATQRSESRGDQIVADGVIYTSVIRLIAHPELYDGKKVEVIGYYVTGQELSSLYLTKVDAQLGNSQSAIWLGLSQSTTNKLVDGKAKFGYVEVIGTFHFDPKGGVGHMGAWPGELRNVSFLQKRK